jgi:hypothetical protein
MHSIHLQKFNLQELNDEQDKEQYKVEISSRFTDFENLHTEEDIKRAWETITKNIKISAKEILGYYEL